MFSFWFFSHIHLGQYQPKTAGRWGRHSKLTKTKSEGEWTKRIQNQGNIFSTKKSPQWQSSDKTAAAAAASTLISSAASITYSSWSPLPPLPLLLWLLRATCSRLFQTWLQVNGNASSILKLQAKNSQVFFNRHRWGSDYFCGISSY